MKYREVDEKSYYLIYQGNIEEAFKNNNIDRYMILNEQLAVIYVPQNYDEARLNNITEIGWWSKSPPMSSLINITNDLEDGENVTVASGTDYIYKNPYSEINGKGVLIAIIDSGIDYLHPDFINEDGTSKIVSIWDQESDKGQLKEGLLFGSVFSRDDINQAIKDNNDSLSIDEVGTGTIAAGIATGLGIKNPNYKGVALGSELVVVKLRSYKNYYHNGKTNYTVSDFLAAISYVLEVCREEQKPMIVNLTVGARSSATTHVSILDTFKDLDKSGIIVVAGAGNEGNTDIHYSGKFDSLDTTQDIIIQVGDDSNLDIVLVTNGPDKIGASIISPSGEISQLVTYAPDYYVYRGKFDLENTTYEMRFIYPWISSGSQQLEMSLRDIKPGVWRLRLVPEFIVTGDYDIYLPNKKLISSSTRFLDPYSMVTITTYGAPQNVITIGAYNDKTDSMWIGSSKGPIKGRRERIKPDIVAPGVDIISTYKSQEYNTGTGTGVSSSIISGILAIIIEYLIQESSFVRISLSTQVLKTYLMLGAQRQEIYNYPNESQGYGILDFKNTIIKIGNNL